MTIKHCLLLTCLVLPFALFAQNTPVWEKHIPADGIKSTHTVATQPTSDNGFVIAATTGITPKGATDVLIIKVNAAGEIEWQKKLGGTSFDYANSIKQTSDGGFIVAASTYSADGDVTANHGNIDVWLIKLTANGSIKWQKSFGGTGEDRANDILPTSDKGFFFTASTRSGNGDVGTDHPSECYWCVKTDSLGNIQWKKYFAGAAFAENNTFISGGPDGPAYLTYSYLIGSIIQATPSKGFVIAGQKSDTIAGIYTGVHYEVVKMDSEGNIEWQKSYPNSATDLITGIKPTGNANGYILVGNTETNIHFDGTPNNAITRKLPYFVKIDINGDLLWKKVDTLAAPKEAINGFQASANCVTVAENGDYFIGGQAGYYGFENTNTYGWLLRLDSLGNKKGFIYPQYAGPFFQVITLPANDFIVAGDWFSTGGQVGESTYVASVYYAKYAAAALPVHITSFTAVKNNNNVQVQWQTAGELNTSHFNVQRSANAIDFTTVGTIAAAGNSTVTRDYRYTDAVTKTGGSFATALYYRLQEVDKHGKITLSKTAKINPDAVNMQLAITPNPATSRLLIQVQNYTGKTAFTIYNMAGQAVKQVAANVTNNNQVAVNIASLPAGTYVVSAVVNGNKINQRFVKQ